MRRPSQAACIRPLDRVLAHRGHRPVPPGAPCSPTTTWWRIWPRRVIETSRRVDRAPAPASGRDTWRTTPRSDLRPRPCRRRCRRSPRQGSQGRRRRPDRGRDDSTPDMIFPSTACDPAGEAWHQQGRRRHSTSRRCARASSTRSRLPMRMVRDRQRARNALVVGAEDLLADPRLERPRHLRAVRRRCRGGRARSRRNEPGILASAPPRRWLATSPMLCVPGTGEPGRKVDRRSAVRAHGRPGTCSSFAVKVLDGRGALETLAKAGRSRSPMPSTG